jgi:hypothetical protein
MAAVCNSNAYCASRVNTVSVIWLIFRDRTLRFIQNKELYYILRVSLAELWVSAQGIQRLSARGRFTHGYIRKTANMPQVVDY